MVIIDAHARRVRDDCAMHRVIALAVVLIAVVSLVAAQPVAAEGTTPNWVLRNSNTTGTADVDFLYGEPFDKRLVGDWDGDGTDTPGVFRDGTFYLRNSNTSGVA